MPFTQESVKEIRAAMQQTHDSTVNLSFSWRIKQLKQLKSLVKDNEEALLQALAQDLGKNDVEAYACEIQQILNEVSVFQSNLSSWMKTRWVGSPAVLIPAFSRVEPRPLKAPAVLIIGPSNYPLSLVLQPLVGSLAAGNPTLLKPSELCPATSAILERLIPQYFPPGVCQVVCGDSKITQTLLTYDWGLVFFTGSQRVGKIVAKAAAETLTPVVLELGGKAPCIVDETAPSDINQIANRIIWAKTLNAGQTCCAVDYLIVHKSIVDKLIPALVKSLRIQFPEGSDSEFGRIVSVQHAQRLYSRIEEMERQTKRPDNAGTEMICGGTRECDVSNRYIQPTIVLNPPLTSRLMSEEIFGPVLPIFVVESREGAISFVNRKVEGTPLCAYVFTKQAKVFQYYNQRIQAGGFLRNDLIVHGGSSLLPFGGIGSSGYGSYHGKNSFDTFSHQLSIIYRPCAPGMDFNMARYHPFKGIKGYVVKNLLLKLPDIPVLYSRFWLMAVLSAVLLYWVLPAIDPF